MKMVCLFMEARALCTLVLKVNTQIFVKESFVPMLGANLPYSLLME